MVGGRIVLGGQRGCIRHAAGNIVVEEVGCNIVAAEVDCSEAGYTDGCIEVEGRSCMSEVLYALLVLLYADWVLGLAVKEG